MKLTTKSEYSLLALIFIAREESGGYVKIEDICGKYGLSKKYLEQLFTVLKNSGYVKTRRGAKGGYMLGKPPSKITLAEIIRLMDGALAPIESVSKYFFSHTPLEKEKKVLYVLRDIRDYVAKRMEETKLSDMI